MHLFALCAVLVFRTTGTDLAVISPQMGVLYGLVSLWCDGLYGVCASSWWFSVGSCFMLP